VSTLPGGRLAPPPPVTRVAAGGLTFLIAAAFAFLWAGVSTMERLTEPRTAQIILKRVLREPHQQEIQNALRTQPGSPIAVDHDLVNFSIDRNAANDVNVPDLLAGQRAVELYQNGMPKDPGIERVETILPRSVFGIFTEVRHKNLGTAKTAALIGMLTAFLLCAVIATGASRFLLPGAAAMLGFLLLRYHIRLINFWLEDSAPGALLFKGRVRLAQFEPARQLLFVTITLLVAGLVFRMLRGPMRAVMRTSKTESTPEAPGSPA
jgi:hypothetical protein